MIKVEEFGAVAVVTYDRGERRNALSLKAMNELIRVADSFQDRFDISAVVLAGSPQAFSAGVDLKDPDRWAIDDKPLDERRHIASTGARMCKAWESVPVPWKPHCSLSSCCDAYRVEEKSLRRRSAPSCTRSVSSVTCARSSVSWTC